ncbi:MAG: GFA family protein [Thermoanaerobaculia bacterium]|nr:GFA family protein [Thermoanaerobaculia bacterium]
MSETRAGGCLCGAVRFELELESSDLGVCHCGTCRRWSAGPFLAVHSTGDKGRLLEDRGLAWYDSSEWARRGFCRECGASLFYQLKGQDSPDWIVSAEALDDTEGLAIASHIYVDAKPAYYDFADDAPRLTEAEFLASMGVGGESEAEA